MADDILLNCSILGCDVGRVFSVVISRYKNTDQLKNAIKEETKPELDHLNVDEFDIWKPPPPFLEVTIGDQLKGVVDGGNIPGAKKLQATAPLSSYFSGPSDPGTVDLVVQLPPSGEDEALVHDQETQQQILRSLAIKTALDRGSPSTIAGASFQRVIQRPGEFDAVHNWRPVALSPTPISIYHPMFFQFTHNLSNPNLNSLTSSALGGALEIIVSFLQFYRSGREKRDAIGRTCLFFEGKSSLLTPTEFSRGSGKTFSPDGHRKSRTPFGIAIPSELIELKNEIGEGGSDAVAQVQRDYACLHSSDEYSAIRRISSCPTLLIAINGPHISVSGAVFAESFYSERLMDPMFIGPRVGEDLNDAIRRVAILVQAVQKGRRTLDDYYATLQEPCFMAEPPRKRFRTETPRSTLPCSAKTCFIGPHFNQYWSDGQRFMLTYKQRFDDKTVFLAEATCENTGESLEVVVKFSTTYGKRGHELLANATPKALAPRLYYCEKPEDAGNLWIVVMEYIEGNLLYNSDAQITPLLRADIAAALDILHAHDIVFGDLRKGNIISSPVGAKLLDFDWCGEDGKVFYPPAINLSRDQDGKSMINWHPGVQRGAPIKKEHDMFMYMYHCW